MDPEFSKIIEKVKSLLRLAEGTSNENEASNALSRAQNLIDKYQIDAQNYRGTSTSQEVTDIQFDPNQISETLRQKHEPIYDGSREILWQTDLAVKLGKLYNVVVYSFRTWNSKKEQRFQLIPVGRLEQVEILRYMFVSIVRQIEALAKQALENRKGGRAGAKTFGNNFRQGAVKTVIGRLTENQQEIFCAANNNVLAIRQKEFDELYQAATKKLRLREQKTTPRQYDSDAYNLGKKAGNSVSLSSGLKPNSSQVGAEKLLGKKS